MNNPRKNNMNILWKSVKVAFAAKSKLSMVVSIVGFIMAFLPAITAVVLQTLTNEVQQLVNGEDVFTEALNNCLILAALFIVQLIYQFFGNYTQNIDYGYAYKKYIRRKLLKYKCEVKYKYIENYDRFNERVAFAENEAGNKMTQSLQGIINIMHDTITFVSIIYLLVNVNIYIVILILVTSIPAIIVSYHQKDELYFQQTKWMTENAMVLHYYYICCDTQTQQEIRHYHIFPYLKKRWRAFADQYCKKKNKLMTKHIVYNSIADFIRNVAYLIVLLITIYQIYENPLIGIGTFTLVYSLTGKMQDVTTRLFTDIVELFGNIPYMKDFFYLDTLEKEIFADANEKERNGDICFQNVSFQYPNKDTKVIHNLNINIREGEKIAIVGKNGSGKSTFISLLCGLFEPLEGSIHFGGEDLNQSPSAIKNSVSAIFQDFAHYDDTLRKNISISDSNHKLSDAELMELVSQIHIEDVVKNQKEGLDTKIGCFSDNYNDLSGGQWQKIAIARAAYKKRASIMILDEPTSELDPIAEAQVYRNFTELTRGKTTLLISHRLGITSLVDRILVFENGEIVEDGSHDELMEKDGYYANMYRAQAQWYISKQN